jgi:hypothetical protein
VKKPTAKKSRNVVKLNPTPVEQPTAPFWHRLLTVKIVTAVIGLVGIIVVGAYSVVNIPAICPAGTAICYHARGPVILDHNYFGNMARVIGMDGGSSLSAHSNVIENTATP